MSDKRKEKRPISTTKESRQEKIPRRRLEQKRRAKTTQRKPLPKRWKPRIAAPTFAAARTPEPMLSGRLEVFWFLLFFVVLFITFDFFLCRSGAGMDGILVQELCKAGLSPSKIFAPNTLARM